MKQSWLLKILEESFLHLTEFLMSECSFDINDLLSASSVYDRSIIIKDEFDVKVTDMNKMDYLIR